MSASSTSHIDRKSQTRPVAVPPSPQTPKRIIPSNFSSPGSSYRNEDDHVVLQIGARHIYAGFAGDYKPRCKLNIDNKQCARVGDYRQWLPGHEDLKRPKVMVSKWGDDRELWKMDVRDLDIKLVEDRLERAFREAYTRHLLLDSKSRKTLLVLPSVLPHSLISAVFTTLFSNFQVPSITLMSTSVLSVLAAGQRSGLVVDIGWHETIITVVYEFRETHQTRTNRAMKNTTLEMGKFLSKFCDDMPSPQLGAESSVLEEDQRMDFDFDCIEETTTRLAWCNAVATDHPTTAYHKRGQRREIQESGKNSGDEIVETLLGPEDIVTVKYSLRKTLQIPFGILCKPVEKALILDNDSPRRRDEDELSVPFLVYQSLQSLSPEVRAICMSNIVFCGGGSNIPGLKSRILYELAGLVELKGWNPVWGQAAEKWRQMLSEIDRNLGSSCSVHRTATEKTETSFVQDQALNVLDFKQTTSGQPLVIDQVEESDGDKKEIQCQIRCISSLGPWSGGSLASCLKLRGIVEIERDSFLQTGLNGARYARELEMTGPKARQSIATSLGRTAGVDGVQWTLGAWG